MSRLLANERPILTARQHWLVLVPAFVSNFLVLVIGLVVLQVAPGLVKGSVHNTMEAWVGLVRLLLLVAVVASSAHRWLQWRSRFYELTNQRIIVNRGVVNRLTTSVSLDRVQDTMVHQGLMERLVHCGDVEIESAGRDGTEVMHLIPDAQGFANALLQAIEAHRRGGYTGGVADDGLGGARPATFEPVPPGQPSPYPGYPPQPVVYPQQGYQAVPAYGVPAAPDPYQPPPAPQAPMPPRQPGYPPAYRPRPGEPWPR